MQDAPTQDAPTAPQKHLMLGISGASKVEPMAPEYGAVMEDP